MILGVHWESWLAWLIAAYLFRSAIINWHNPKFVKDDYERWGFPAWFNRFNAGYLAVAGLLLILPVTRLAGLALVLALCAGIFVTLIRYREFGLMRNPAILLVLTCVCAGSRVSFI